MSEDKHKPVEISHAVQRCANILVMFMVSYLATAGISPWIHVPYWKMAALVQAVYLIVDAWISLAKAKVVPDARR
jgi:hypothetical protein